MKDPTERTGGEEPQDEGASQYDEEAECDPRDEREEYTMPIRGQSAVGREKVAIPKVRLVRRAKWRLQVSRRGRKRHKQNDSDRRAGYEG
jgi:hypothetical protein